MARIFMYDGQKLDDPDPGMSVDEVRQSYAEYFPELYNATGSEKKDGEDTVITFQKRVGTKGGQCCLNDRFAYCTGKPSPVEVEEEWITAPDGIHAANAAGGGSIMRKTVTRCRKNIATCGSYVKWSELVKTP